MDIVLTIIASVLLLVGFLVVCRTSLEDEEEYEEEEENSRASPRHSRQKILLTRARPGASFAKA